MKNLMLAGLLTAVSLPVAAQQVQRCVQQDGSVAFTQGACKGEAVESITIDAAPVHPDPQRSLPAYTLPPRQEQPRRQPRVTVVGGSECQVDMSTTEARRRGYVVEGMSHEQVIAVYGRPDRSSKSSGGYTSMTWYSTVERPYRSVDFRDGCATRVYQARWHDDDNRRRHPGTRANTIRR